MSAFKSMEVDDLVNLGSDVWRISGVYLGSEGQQSVIGLTSIHKKPSLSTPSDGEMLVPYEFIHMENIYRMVKPATPKGSE